MRCIARASETGIRRSLILRSAARSSPPFVCLLIGLISVTLLTFLTPPFEVPDEPQHFFRSYQLSELGVWGISRNGVGGAVLPSSLPELVEHFLGTRAIFADRSLAPHPLMDTWRQFRRPLDPHRREFVDFSGAVFYSPLPYLPQALAIWLGRVLDAPPLALLYLGRLLNGIVAVVLVAWGLRVLPFGREAALVAALLPMAQFEYASVSPDAAVIASAFLSTAVALRASLRAQWLLSDIIVCGTSGAVFCSVKPVYVPLLLIGLGSLFRRSGGAPARASRVLRVHLLTAGVAVAVTTLWLSSASSTIVVYHDEANFWGQLGYILYNPATFIWTLFTTILLNVGFYFRTCVGMLGWFTLPLPSYAYQLAAGGFLLSPIAQRLQSPPVLGLGAAFWNLFLISSSIVLMETALYLYWNPRGASLIGGVQGRYFLPLLPLLGATFCDLVRPKTSPKGSAIAYAILVLTIAINTALMHIVIANAYHTF
jgi:uncharacterized membrane protein